jgi:DNA-binding CsgD family transcriptional regulator
MARLSKAAASFKLSPRELEFVLLLAAGETLKGAAGRMGISPRTVEVKARLVRLKTGAHSNAEALATLLLFEAK